MSIQISDRSVLVPIKEITTDFHVRYAFNQEWAIEIALMLTNGVEFDPIYITRDKRSIDGRHRLEGYELADRTEIRCKYVDADSEVEYIAFALQCNMGRGLPATKLDIEHTIQILMDRGASKKELVDILAPMPEKLVKTYLRDLESRMERTKLTKAAAAVVDGGLTVGKASQQYNVVERDLKSLLYSKTRRKATKNGVEEMRRNFSKAYQAQGNRTGKTITRLLEMYRDGDVTPKQVLDIFEHLNHLLKTAGRAISNHRKRFEELEAPKKIA